MTVQGRMAYNLTAIDREVQRKNKYKMDPADMFMPEAVTRKPVNIIKLLAKVNKVNHYADSNKDGCTRYLDEPFDVWADVQQRRKDGDPLMMGGRYKDPADYVPAQFMGVEGKGIAGSRRKDMGVSR